MLTKVQKWGNSLAVRIPKAYVHDAHLKHDSSVEITLVKGQIIITPEALPTFKLEDLLNGTNKKNIHQEIETGGPVGKEIW